MARGEPQSINDIRRFVDAWMASGLEEGRIEELLALLQRRKELSAGLAALRDDAQGAIARTARKLLDGTISLEDGVAAVDAVTAVRSARAGSGFSLSTIRRGAIGGEFLRRAGATIRD